MKKYYINYSRKFPYHRQPTDRDFNKMILESPKAYYKHFKIGMNYAMFNYYGYIVGLVLCGVYTVMICYKSKDEHIADHFTDQRRGSLTNFAFLNYFFGAEKAGIGRYDNILNQFYNETGGLRDQPYREV